MGVSKVVVPPKKAYMKNGITLTVKTWYKLASRFESSARARFPTGITRSGGPKEVVPQPW